MIADIIGIEAELHSAFRRWSNSVTAGGNAAALSEAQRVEIRRDAAEFRAYFLERIESARRQPREDLITALVTAEEQGQSLSADEVLALCVLLLIAGNETTTTLLSNTLICLRDFPTQEQLVRTNRALMPNWSKRVCATSRRCNSCSTARRAPLKSLVSRSRKTPW